MEPSSQLSSNKESITELLARMSSFEDRLDKATTSSPSKISPPDSSDPMLRQEFVEFKRSVWQVLMKLNSRIDLVSLGLDRHEAFMRRKVLLFHGVPEIKEEKVSEVVVKLMADKMQMSDIATGDLQSCHRLGTSTDKARPVLVRFREMEHRRIVWDSKTMLKGTGVVLSEFLTKARHDVFMAARKHFGVNNCWSVEGKITIILPNKSRTKIETGNQLQALVTRFPNAREPAPPAGTPRDTPPEVGVVKAPAPKGRSIATKPAAAPVTRRARK